MVNATSNASHAQSQPRAAQDAASFSLTIGTQPDATLATQAFQYLLTLAALPVSEQNRAAQQTAAAEHWTPWTLGGFSFSDGSVLLRSAAGWQSLSADEALEHLNEQSKQPLEVRLRYAFQAGDGRQKFTVTEARFCFQAATNRWRLVIEYEAYMNSPLYGFQTERFAHLAVLNIWELRVVTLPYQRWQLEQIATHPDWLELLLISSRP